MGFSAVAGSPVYDLQFADNSLFAGGGACPATHRMVGLSSMPWRGMFFLRTSYRNQREAVRELALADPAAYTFLLLEGIIVVNELVERKNFSNRHWRCNA